MNFFIFIFLVNIFVFLNFVSADTGHDAAVNGAKLEDRFYNNDSFKVRLREPSIILCSEQWL